MSQNAVDYGYFLIQCDLNVNTSLKLESTVTMSPTL